MEQRNMILAFALSMLILLGWGLLFPPADNSGPNVNREQSAAVKTPGEDTATPELRPDAEDLFPSAPAETPAPALQETAASGKVIAFGNDLLKLSVNEKGWVINASLNQYRESLKKGSASVSVLGEREPHVTYLNAGLMGEKDVSVFRLLSKETINGADRVVTRATLSDGRTWDRIFTLSPGSYLITIDDRIQNGSGIKLFRQVVERHPDREIATFYEHAGSVGLMDGVLQEESYDDLDESGTIRLAATGGWTGTMGRYFITAIFGNQQRDYRYYYKGDGRSYQSGMIDDGIMDGSTAVFQSTVFIGPKSIPILRQAGVGLERSVDFGWFAFISKPLHDGISWLYKYFPNYGVCIILLVIGIKILFFYPTQKSYESMAAMRKLQPEQKRLQERFGDDRQRLGQEMMALYKKNKVNPLGGCLPIIIQIPVFFALYKVLLMSIEMRQAPFMGWIQDLSAQDPYFVLPLLMGISMYLQQKMNPQPIDAMQAKIMSFLPALFTVMFLFFPAGLVLYWLVNNILAIIQQRLVMKTMGVD
ncbi:MAG: membrane protein insertase YidC [Mariprofundaceae bacterium]|nr:membrane protein insertase YidC [Mariprofundaceae bacterium]